MCYMVLANALIFSYFETRPTSICTYKYKNMYMYSIYAYYVDDNKYQPSTKKSLRLESKIKKTE